MATLLVW